MALSAHLSVLAPVGLRRSVRLGAKGTPLSTVCFGSFRGQGLTPVGDGYGLLAVFVVIGIVSLVGVALSSFLLAGVVGTCGKVSPAQPLSRRLRPCE